MYSTCGEIILYKKNIGKSSINCYLQTGLASFHQFFTAQIFLFLNCDNDAGVVYSVKSTLLVAWRRLLMQLLTWIVIFIAGR